MADHSAIVVYAKIAKRTLLLFQVSSVNDRGAIVFVTMRTLDSIPKEVIERWQSEKREWFEKRGFPFVANWKDSLSQIPTKERQLFKRHFQRTREDYLDSGMGLCLLRKRDLAEMVAKSLMHFDGDRYNMGDFIIMPNHIHLLGAFYDAESMQKQFDSWLHWTARHINLAMGTKGSFWQEEPFDHLVRTEKQYEYLREYIANNPGKAKLPAGEFYYRRHDS